MDNIDINDINETNVDKYDYEIWNKKISIFDKNDNYDINVMNQLNMINKLTQKINDVKRDKQQREEKEHEVKFIENMKKINDNIKLELNDIINKSNSQINKNISYTYNDYKNCIKKCKGYGEGDSFDESCCHRFCFDNPNFHTTY